MNIKTTIARQIKDRDPRKVLGKLLKSINKKTYSVLIEIINESNK